MLCATAVTNTIGFRSRSSQSTSANCSGVMRVSGRRRGDVEGQREVAVGGGGGGLAASEECGVGVGGGVSIDYWLIIGGI